MLGLHAARPRPTATTSAATTSAATTSTASQAAEIGPVQAEAAAPAGSDARAEGGHVPPTTARDLPLNTQGAVGSRPHDVLLAARSGAPSAAESARARWDPKAEAQRVVDELVASFQDPGAVRALDFGHARELMAGLKQAATA